MMRRCDTCRDHNAAYCKHNGVLLVYIEGTPLFVRGSTEERARRTADKVRIAWRGEPFHRRQEPHLNA